MKRSERVTGALLTILAAMILAGCGGSSGNAPPPDPLYVSPEGVDGNLGTVDEPVRTISYAASVALDDYTIIVAPGTYREAVTTDRVGAPAQGLTFIADTTGELSGVAAGEVIIRAPGGDRVTGFKLNKASNTTISGFTITRATGGGIVVNQSLKVRIQSCTILNNEGDQADGIRVQDSPDALIFNNLVVRNSGTGIAIVGRLGSPGARIINNTVYQNGFRGITIGTSDGASTGAFLRNNILDRNGIATESPLNIRVLTVPPSTTDYDGDFDLVFPGSYAPTSLRGTNDVDADPRYQEPDDIENPSFRLRPDSPAINEGTPALHSDELRDCLRAWSATVDNAADTGRPDIGFHYPQGNAAAVNCGIKLPSEMPTP